MAEKKSGSGTIIILCTIIAILLGIIIFTKKPKPSEQYLNERNNLKRSNDSLRNLRKNDSVKISGYVLQNEILRKQDSLFKFQLGYANSIIDRYEKKLNEKNHTDILNYGSPDIIRYFSNNFGHR